MHPLIRLTTARLGLALLTLIAVSVLIFIATEQLPGDVAQAILGQGATEESIAALRRDLGLDRPAHTRFAEWIGHALRGDFGHSLANGIAIDRLIAEPLRNTLVLALAAASLAVPLSLGLGLLAALHRGRPTDRTVLATSLLTVSLPEFLVGYLLMYVFAVQLGWVPPLSLMREDASVSEWLTALALPVVTLVVAVTAHTMRLVRSAIISVLATDYIQMAEIKGLPPWHIITRHALPNVLSPVLSIVMLTLAYLIVGVVIVESVFNYAGMGKLMVDAVANRDVPLVQACGLIFSSVFVILNFGADLLAILANPRLMYGR